MENKVFVLDTHQLEDQKLFDKYCHRMRQTRRDRVERMRFPDGKRLVLGAGIITEKCLDYAGKPEAPITVTDAGKPTVDGLYFNISHTSHMVVGAVSDKEVGVDIEHIRSFDKPLLKRAFTENERASAEEKKTRDAYFTRLWTIKESVMKWYGLGLSLDPGHIEITREDKDIRVSLIDKPELPDPSLLHFTLYEHLGYLITVCSCDFPFTSDITPLALTADGVL
ncbi:MAG TPA: hypothetical protein DCP06_05195 [Lachnospiraceae bacterium]|nr:hypothetical protein [Lachnospiraceae bacterium]